MSKTFFFLTVNHYDRSFNPEYECDEESCILPETVDPIAASESMELMEDAFRKLCSHFLFDTEMFSNSRYGYNWFFEILAEKGPEYYVVSLSEAQVDDISDIKIEDGCLGLQLGGTVLGEGLVLNDFISSPFIDEEEVPITWFPMIDSIEQLKF